MRIRLTNTLPNASHAFGAEKRIRFVAWYPAVVFRNRLPYLCQL